MALCGRVNAAVASASHSECSCRSVWRCVAVIRTISEIWRSRNRDEYQVAGTVCHGLGEKPQTHKTQEPGKPLVLSQVHEVVGAICCALPPTRNCGQVHIPQGVELGRNQGELCKKEDPSERVPLPGEPGQRQNGSGFCRSSAQLVTALCSAGLQDGATGAGAHTCTEPVLLGSAAIIWLKGALHGASYETSPLRGAEYVTFLCQRHETNACERLTDTEGRHHQWNRFPLLIPLGTPSPVSNFRYPQLLLRSDSPARQAGRSSTPCGLCCGRRLGGRNE